MKKLLIPLFLGLTAPVALADVPLQEALEQAEPDLRPLITSVLESSSYTADLEVCPIDRFPRFGGYGSGDRECRDSLRLCRAMCWMGNGKACFGLARAIEKSETSNRSEFKYPLFLAACAAGNANGCTNAGATAKNGLWLAGAPQAANTFDCQFRTYKTSCEAGAAWGCYMLGGAYTDADAGDLYAPDLAEAAYRRACLLGPTSGACLKQYKPDITP